MAAEMIDVITGISQVMANTYDGAKNEKGEPIKAGLRREEPKDFRNVECRLVDGFRARVGGCVDPKTKETFPCLIISYQSELKIEEMHDPKLEERIEEHISEVINYLKSEYKKVTGQTLTLESHGEMHTNVEQTSRIRTFVTAQCHYKLNGVNYPTPKDKLDDDRDEVLKKWLALGGLKK